MQIYISKHDKSFKFDGFNPNADYQITIPRVKTEGITINKSVKGEYKNIAINGKEAQNLLKWMKNSYIKTSENLQKVIEDRGNNW